MNSKSPLVLAIGSLLATPIMAEEMYVFDEVVVTGTRTEQSKKDSSSSIETVSADELEANLANDLKEVFKYTPGVEAQGSGRFGVGGMNIRGMEDSRVKMMVDGVQQPTPLNPGASEQRKYPNTIEIDTLQAIEVNKGPSSTLYGSDALGGVVLLRTKNPDDVLITNDDEDRFGVKASYASASDEFKTTLIWAKRQGDLETLLMATYADGSETETHGSGANIEGPDRGAANPADKKIGNLLGKAFYQVNDNHRIGFTAEYYNSQYDEDELNYNGYAIMPGFVYSDNYNEDVNERLRIGFEHEMFMDTVIAEQLNWSVNYQDSASQSDNYDTTPFTGRRMREREATDTSVQFDAQLLKVIEHNDNSHEITYGISYQNNDFSLTNTDHKYDAGTVSPGSTPIPDANVTQWGMFVQDQAFLLDERFVITAGLRYDSFNAEPSADDAHPTKYDQNSDDAFTAKLGSVYHFNDNLSVFGQIGQGFKAPTVYDLYYFYTMGAIIEANPDLKAEKSLSYELGFRGQNEAANFELALFYNDYTDFITQETTGQQGGKDVYTKRNLDEVEIYGVEFSSRVNLDTAFNAPQGTYARTAVTFLEGEDKKTGDTLDSIAPLTGVVGLGFDRDNFGGAFNVKMVAAKDKWQSDDNVNIAGYSVVDLTAYYMPVEDLTISAGLFNMFDKKYWLYSEHAGRSNYIFNKDAQSQPGRNWGVSVEYLF